MDVDGLSNARLAMDANSLNGLRRAATKDPKGQLDQVAKKFEALFLDHMLKSMRKAGYHSDLTDNRRVRFYQQMFDQQLSQKLAERGMGLARMLVHQLSPAVDSQANHGKPAVAIRPGTVPQALAGYPPVMATAAAPASASAAGAEAASEPRQAGSFVKRFAHAARTAAQASGVSPLLILAQAALETGWGRNMAEAADGASSHNLFGVKAGSEWQGETAENRTLEYRAGRAGQETAAFRMYDSFAQSFADHARLLGQSPRYAPVRAATTPQAQARALQASGYATDPRYADKLIAIMRQIGSLSGL